MPLLTVVLILILVGVLLWLVNQYIPMDPVIKRVLNILVLIVVILWLLSLFGLIPLLSTIRVGQ